MPPRTDTGPAVRLMPRPWMVNRSSGWSIGEPTPMPIRSISSVPTVIARFDSANSAPSL